VFLFLPENVAIIIKSTSHCWLMRLSSALTVTPDTRVGVRESAHTAGLVLVRQPRLLTVQNNRFFRQSMNPTPLQKPPCRCWPAEQASVASRFTSQQRLPDLVEHRLATTASKVQHLH
jgi:hypothetical protein